jgi:hypothetical protein
MKRIPTIKRTCRTQSVLGALLFAAASFCEPAGAQVPPHRPGTICFTPTFWCWSTNAGIPGQSCWCPSPWGAVQGTLG